MKRSTFSAVLVLAALIALVFVVNDQLLSIGAPVGRVSDDLRVAHWDRMGGVRTVEYDRTIYPDCGYSAPGAVFLEAGGYYRSYDLLPVSGWSEWERDGVVWNRNWEIKESRGFYALSPQGPFTYERPVQDESCQEPLREFLRSSGVNITQVVVVESQETIYVDRTVYVCPGGELTLDEGACENPGIAASPQPLWRRVWEWLRGLL